MRKRASSRTTLINLFFVLATIVVTAFIMRRNQLAEMALRDSRHQLAHLMRITTLGELTASIAHEVKQPITAAVTNADAALRFLRAQPPDLEEVTEALGCIVDNGNQAGEISNSRRACRPSKATECNCNR